MGVLFQAIGFLLSLPSIVWLMARLIAPHGMTRLQSVSVFVPMALIGGILVWCGRKMDREGKT